MKCQFRYEETVIEPENLGYLDDLTDKIGALDLREEAWEALNSGRTVKVYHITVLDEHGENLNLRKAEGLLIPDSGRVGIAWAAYTDWMDTTNDIDIDIDMWLNDYEQFEARN